jgi:hypothetical protein
VSAAGLKALLDDDRRGLIKPPLDGLGNIGMPAGTRVVAELKANLLLSRG